MVSSWLSIVLFGEFTVLEARIWVHRNGLPPKALGNNLFPSVPVVRSLIFFDLAASAFVITWSPPLWDLCILSFVSKNTGHRCGLDMVSLWLPNISALEAWFLGWWAWWSGDWHRCRSVELMLALQTHSALSRVSCYREAIPLCPSYCLSCLWFLSLAHVPTVRPSAMLWGNHIALTRGPINEASKITR